jgi:predicted  nucleic acid-binding Zn-ribbon protein
MKSQQEAKQLQQIEAELQQKDTTFEQELTKQIQEKKAAPIKAMEEVRYEVELPQPEMPKMGKKAVAKAQRLPRPKFGIETIRVPREGVYEINIDALMQKRPIIVLEKGRVYFIHLPSVFEKVRIRE